LQGSGLEQGGFAPDFSNYVVIGEIIGWLAHARF
jgi:hypothetical protein